MNIIGQPNAGKSTLMNALIGERLAVVNPKAQTTRHRVLGILNGTDFQMIFSDTPGIIEPAYKLQERMMTAVWSALEDADVLLFLDDLSRPFTSIEFVRRVGVLEAPLVVVLNKSDLVSELDIEKRAQELQEVLQPVRVIACSALTGENLDGLVKALASLMPEHPAYFPSDQLTDKTERFFVTEIIRGKILSHYKQEIPYACEVAIENYEEKPDITVIRALIFVERDSQKNIIIGRKGEMLKKVGTEARADIEKLLGVKVFLELHVKVRAKWRQKDDMLDRFGY